MSQGTAFTSLQKLYRIVVSISNMMSYMGSYESIARSVVKYLNIILELKAIFIFKYLLFMTPMEIVCSTSNVVNVVRV